MNYLIFSLISITIILNFNYVICQFFRPGYEPQSVINSLLTPIFYYKPINSECVTASDSRIGVCMAKAACISSGGTPVGVCNLVLSCCIYQGTCKSVITANETYFVSPQYPVIHSDRLDPPICIFTLQRNTKFTKIPVCQIRLDLTEFSLAPPINGTCGNGQTDSFIISGGTNFNHSGLPNDGICGELTGQHLYLDVDSEKTDDTLLLVVNTANEQIYNRKWSIRIQQVPCTSPYRAPPGCLQYHTGQTGTVESLNFRGITRPSTPGVISSPNYFNNMHYGICVSKKANMCAIRWSAVQFDFGGLMMGQSSTETPTQSASGCVEFLGVDVDDSGDYIIIPASSATGRSILINRMCGQRLNPSLIDSASNADVILHSDSRFQVSINPGAPQNQKGFQIRYSQIAC